MADLSRLRTTAEIEDMAGRPFTGDQLREAIAEIERLRAALREIKTMPAIKRTDYRLMEIIDAALAG